MRFLPFWFCLLVCGSAAAQTISDTELRAGYCLGVAMSHAEAKTAELKEDTGDQIIKDYDQRTLRSIEERQKRFQDYLTAKGTRDRSPEAFRIASERGKKDVAACEIELEQEFYKGCADRCERLSGEDESSYPACYDKCPHPDSCTRVGKCLENFLPF
jgi:hypothetical protein